MRTLECGGLGGREKRIRRKEQRGGLMYEEKKLPHLSGPQKKFFAPTSNVAGTTDMAVSRYGAILPHTKDSVCRLERYVGGASMMLCFKYGLCSYYCSTVSKLLTHLSQSGCNSPNSKSLLTPSKLQPIP